MQELFLSSGGSAGVYHYIVTHYADSVIQIERPLGSVIASLAYENEGNDVVYISLVKVEPKYRRKGLHTLLLKELVKLTKATSIHFTIGYTNLRIFKEYLDSGETYASQLLASKNIPTGKVLYSMGFTDIVVDIKTYFNNKEQRIINLYFDKGEE